MPIYDMTSTSAKNWFNWRTIYCLVLQACIILVLLTQIYGFIIDHNFNYGRVMPVVFYLDSLLISFNFVYIARNIPRLASSWNDLDKKYPEQVDNDTRPKRIFKALVAFGLAAFFEHFLSKVEDYEVASYCFHRHKTGFETFVRTILPTFYMAFDFNFFNGLFIVVISFFSTVLWNFSDIFQITVFYGIYSKLRNFNKRIARQTNRHYDEQFWLDARMNYTAIHENVKSTNDVMSFTIALALVTDFYITCNQVLGAFKWVNLSKKITIGLT